MNDDLYEELDRIDPLWRHEFECDVLKAAAHYGLIDEGEQEDPLELDFTSTTLEDYDDEELY